MFARILAVAVLSLVLASCTSSREEMGRGSGTPGAFKVGNPYQIDGVTYYPREDYKYDQTGIASWYGPGFEGRQTANGETFDSGELTAAHQTLPMPSLVRVTNLENGRSVVVRVNDRGPFANNRIIDLSRRAAQLLGFENNGTAKVRVQVMAVESRAIADAARKRGYTAPVTSGISSVASNTNNRPPPVAEIPAGEVSADEEITVNAGMEKVDSAPLGAPSGAMVAPAPVEVAEIPPAPRPVKMAANGTPQPLTTEPKFKNVAGKSVGGRFLPAPEVKQQKVASSQRIFIQVGAFAVQENATRLNTKMANLAASNVSETTVGGKRFYRVRLGPIASVQEADRILAKVLPENKTARITIE